MNNGTTKHRKGINTDISLYRRPCSPLGNSGVTHAHIACRPGRTRHRHLFRSREQQFHPAPSTLNKFDSVHVSGNHF